MEEHLTTRQVAEALSVSESSVKRWCDSGDIPTVRTVGGHRRIPLAGFMEFLEETKRQVVSPLLPTNRLREVGTRVDPVSQVGDPKALFLQALKDGDENRCRKVLTTAYASRESIAWLADEFIMATFQTIGQQWDCGDLEIYQERRGCEICSRLLHELRRLIPEVPQNGPLAIGGAPEGDQYTLPTQIVELVLRENGWRTMNLGSNLPLPTIAAAVQQHQPRMLWLSVSHLEDQEAFVSGYAKLAEVLPKETVVVIGGRALTDDLRPHLKYHGHCDNMQQLALFAAAMHGKRHPLNSSDN